MHYSPFQQVLILIAASLLAAAGTHALHPRAPGWYLSEATLQDDEVTLATIQERWNNDVLWLDARPRSAYEAEHIPGALLLNEQEATDLLFQHIDKLQDNEKPVIIYCDAASCQASRKMKEYLKERLPIEEMYILHDGWKAWKKAHP